MLLQAIGSDTNGGGGTLTTTTTTTTKPSNGEQVVRNHYGTGTGLTDGTNTHILDYAPAPGWTVHVTKDGRLYYCNHVTRTAGWLPPAEAWRNGEDSLPYGWERAVDNAGRQYYINHVNKTTTYETPIAKNFEPPAPEPRQITLERSSDLGFGFVAGSEKPVIVRFVTEGGPSVDKLLPGDQILSVNSEDVKEAPREHVIALVRACATTVDLLVCQPPEQQGIRKSTLLSASKRARLRSKPSRPSAFSLGDLCVAPMANVLKVFLENGQTKSFKYDAWTTIADVVTSLETKLCLTATEHFSLVVEHIKSLKRNKLTLLDPNNSLARIASRPGAHKLRCLFRVAFVPSSAANLAQKDLNALDYLYIQCCNDVIQERFAPELQYDTALRLAALHIYQHALSNNIQAAKLTVKMIERDFGFERFVPASLLENMKRKEVRKLIGHFLKLHSAMPGPGKQLTSLQAKLHYLDIVSQLPSYGAKCFSAGPKADALERVILVSPKFGISQITGTRNSVPVPIANIDDMRRIEVRTDDEISRTVLIRLANEKTVSMSLEERDAHELVLVLVGYYRLFTNRQISVDRDEIAIVEDLAPPYLSEHRVIPEKWSYTNQNALKPVCFTLNPGYQAINRKTNGLYNTMGRQSAKPPLMLAYSLDSNMNSSFSNRNHASFDTSELRSVVSREMLVEAKNEEVVRRVAEMQQLVENSAKYLSEQASLGEWPETSVDVESDGDQPTLKHSDSLLLLNRIAAAAAGEARPLARHALDLLRCESLNHSESDTDCTPHHSPHRVSFGLARPAAADLIDLTQLPPPGTPDELDGALRPLHRPPTSFADGEDELERFLALVAVQPPQQKLTPAVELTPEEIMGFIIPPPPARDEGRRSSAAAFGCCARRPPERPPKNFERQRSLSLSAPPKLPPREGAQLPRRPPLPPAPPPDALRARRPPVGERTAGIGSPHLARARPAGEGAASPVLGRNGCGAGRGALLGKTDVAMASLLVRLDQVAAQCTAAQVHGGGRLICEEKFQLAKEELTTQSLQLVTSSKMLVIAMSDPSLPDLPENLAICLTILRRLTELCQDLTNHTTAPLQTRNLILKVHDVTATFRHLITSHIDRSTQKSIEEHLASEAESLANVLATLLRSLRVFSP